MSDVWKCEHCGSVEWSVAVRPNRLVMKDCLGCRCLFYAGGELFKMGPECPYYELPKLITPQGVQFVMEMES